MVNSKHREALLHNQPTKELTEHVCGWLSVGYPCLLYRVYIAAASTDRVLFMPSLCVSKHRLPKSSKFLRVIADSPNATHKRLIPGPVVCEVELECSLNIVVHSIWKNNLDCCKVVIPRSSPLLANGLPAGRPVN